jgi:hypothetical protein
LGAVVPHLVLSFGVRSDSVKQFTRREDQVHTRSERTVGVEAILKIVNAKAQKENRAIEALRHHSWAAQLLSSAAPESSAEGFRFELRFGYEITRIGATSAYEHEAGVGSSTVDFNLVSGDACWNIELVSIETSEAVNTAIVRESLSGLRVETLLLGREIDRPDGVPLLPKQCPESEMLRLMSKLEGKLQNSRGLPAKFPIPKPGVFNMLLVNVRNYEGFGYPDRDHCRQIVGGPAIVHHPENVMSHPDGAPIHGLWDEANVRPAARIARERLHVLAFVHEEVFSDDEIREVTVLFLNPNLECDVTTYPLRWPASADGLRTPLRATNALWNSG